MRPSRRWLGWVVPWIYAFLHAPIAVIVVGSFNASKHGGPWSGFTTGWYARLLDSPEKGMALWNTLVLAVCSTGISVVLGTLLGFGLSRYRFRGRELVGWLMQVPVVVPDIVMAIALLMLFAALRERLGWVQLGMGAMIVSHVTFQIPFVAMVVRARLAGLDPAIEEAAHDLGATAWQKLRHVLLPLAMPGILAGAALAFTLSVDDFVVSFFTSGPGATTLPILIYASVKRGITPDIHALSTLIILVSVAGALASTWFQGSGRGREARG